MEAFSKQTIRSIISGHIVVMGYNTWLSIGCRPLSNNKNIVVSSTCAGQPSDGVVFINSLDNLVDHVCEGKRIYIVGGVSLITAVDADERMAISHLHLIHINYNGSCDMTMPFDVFKSLYCKALYYTCYWPGR